MFRIEIIDDDEIEVGARRHLARAEPAERDNRRLLAADAAMDEGEIGFDARMQGADENVGQRREHLACPLGRQRAGENARTDQKHMLLPEQADGIEHVFIAARGVERVRQFLLQARGVGQRAEEARIDQRIDHVRMLRQNIGKAAAPPRG